MRFKVRIYDPSNQEQPPRPIATVTLTDKREQACWLPKPVAVEAWFFLERVEAESEEVEQRIRSALQKNHLIVSKSSSDIIGAVRTRGDYSAEEAHGTPAYWRAAIGRLEGEAGLIEDLEDYGRMLQKMEAAAPLAAEPEPAVATRSHVLYQCSLYIIRNLGDGYWAGKATYDESLKQWTVPIRAESLGEEAPVGEFTLDVQGNIRHAPSRRTLQETVQRYQLSLKERLTAALNQLASVRQDLRERLTAWREQLESGAVHAEATVRAVMTAVREGTVEVLQAMSHPSLQFQYVGADIRVERGETTRESQAASAVVFVTDAVPSARVTVEEDAVVVTFLYWQAPSPPLVVLVPDDERKTPQTPDRVEGEGGAWTARFEHVPPGSYLLAVAPVNTTLSF